MNRYRNLPTRSRRIFWVVLAAMIVIGLYGFFTSALGRTVSLVCCGGLILVVVVGLLSERGMQRPQ